MTHRRNNSNSDHNMKKGRREPSISSSSSSSRCESISDIPTAASPASTSSSTPCPASFYPSALHPPRNRNLFPPLLWPKKATQPLQLLSTPMLPLPHLTQAITASTRRSARWTRTMHCSWTGIRSRATFRTSGTRTRGGRTSHTRSTTTRCSDSPRRRSGTWAARRSGTA